MSEIVYAVHTRACTYLLDEEGFCRWVLSRSGAKSDDRCVGAQFVAALDLRSKGGLVGELRIGSQALFIRSENGRFALIRTKAIEHVEVRGADSEEAYPGEEAQSYEAQGYDAQAYANAYGGEPEAEPVVLPDHLAVAAVFNAPVPAPEPPPPSARVILQTPRTEPPPAAIASPETEPLPPMPPPARSFPQAPPREIPRPREMPRVRDLPPSRPPPAYAEAPQAYEPPAYAPPPAYASPAARSSNEGRPASSHGFPAAPARASRDARSVPRPSQPRNDPSQETQPLPPAGPVPAWPPMLAPPPPQAQMLPLGPARAALPSAEELDVDDLEEVGEDDQIYSMEVTLSLPLFRADQNTAATMGAPRPHTPGGVFRR